MKLRNYIILLQLLTTTFFTNAQTYGNEWIDYSQSYYTFKIVDDGIYKLDYSTLNNAGVPMGLFSSDNIQLFGREREIPIHVEDGGDNSMDPGDYVLFYAERNDGWLDSTLYVDPSTIGNPEYSLVNDTLLYFFTWSSNPSNLRYAIETDVDFATFPTVSDYIIHKHVSSYSQEYFEGVKLSNASSSYYTAGEGWGKSKTNGAQGTGLTTLYASTKFPYASSGAPNALFTALSVSASDAGNGDNHHLQWKIGASDTIIHDSQWNGYNQVKVSESFSPLLLANGNTHIKFQIVNDLGAATDYQSYQYFSVEYPRQLIFNGAYAMDFEVVNATSQSKIRLDVSSAGLTKPIMLVHGDTPRIVPFVPNGGFQSVLIPNSASGGRQTVLYQDSSLIYTVDAIIPVNGNGSFNDFSTYNLEEALIMIYHPSMDTASIAYDGYRTSGAGGTYQTILASVEELYLQFGGGVDKHISGVRRFAHFVYNNSTIKPVGLFLMGKAIREADFNLTTSDGPGTRKNAARFEASMIPSFGQPSSDVCITAGLESVGIWSPLMATGRISARTNAELQDYLNKVLEYEIEQDPLSVYDSPNKDWQKHVIHFTGGTETAQQNEFQGYMNNMEAKIEGSLFGAEVDRVYKSTSNPLDPTVLQGVTDRISDGVSLMSYFGHASGTSSGFEINLDDPASWNNQGKYPVMLVNSCYNGNIFQNDYSKSEEFVQVANYGAIAYIASVGLGFTTQLNTYSQNLYTNFSSSMYGSTLGEMMKSNIQFLEGVYAGNLTYETTAMQMVLNGDPMLKLNTHSAPEIEITPQSVTYLPTNFNLTVDSIEMQIDLKNLGHSVTDTFQLVVERNFPNSAIDSVYIFSIPVLHYTDRTIFKMPLQANIGVGINTFNIRVDIPSAINEQYDEVSNNQLNFNIYINIDGIVPVIPYEFAVVPEDLVTVKASTINPIADMNSYRFEIDTVDFEGTVPQSGQYRYAIVTDLGGVKEIDPSNWLAFGSGTPFPLVCEDSVVYFWRVSIVGDTNWRESSFQYITGKTGWGQDHFYQFKKNGFNNLDYDRPTRRREFNPDTQLLECNVNSATGGIEVYSNNYLIDGNQIAYGVGMGLTPKIHVAVMDAVTLDYWGTYWLDTTGPFDIEYNPGNSFGNGNDNSYFVWKYFTFAQNSTAELDSFQNMVLNEVGNGNNLLIYAPMVARYDWWDIYSPSMYATFAALGSDSIYAGRENRPFAFYVKKGFPSSTVEEIPAMLGGDAHLEALMTGDITGKERSTLIGPASNWGSVHWKQDSDELIQTDTTLLTITAYDQFGSQQMIIDTNFSFNDSIINLNTLIDATLYPYIDLNATYRDPLNPFPTPAQVDRWHVLYTPLPEAAIDGSEEYTWSLLSDTLEEGQNVEFAVDVKNIFTIDMDSLLINYWVEDASHVKHVINYPRQKPLLVGETFRDTITIPTLGLGGINSFWMEVNPYLNGQLIATDQPEQLHFNNLLQIPFFVNPDDKNPILDVTFNGTHILNGDIIDPSSVITITLKDDNDFLIMDDISDTTLFGVYLTDPSGILHSIPFETAGQTVMQWIPATAQNKRFQIIWPAEFDQDGTYTLFVQGTDRSGNISGDIEYKVSFDIIHKSTITKMMNYPNPFSTSTRFVFTLTGTEVPDEIIIQIMTVTGKVVREITEDELGFIQIGRNISEYAWNGTDEFGDPLANGVYLYRVKAQINGEDIENRDSGADQYFKKEFGKMYLMR